MDKIKTVKIKNPDGSISEESYTISVDAKDVDMDNGKELQETIGTIDIDIDGNIAEQLENLNNEFLKVSYIKDIVNNLDSEENNKSLSANMGNKLNKNKINKYNSVNDMKLDTDLKEGMVAETLGYYTVNDGGGATYLVTNVENQTEYHEELKNGLYATLINNVVNVNQFGAYGDGIHDDSDAIQNAFNYSNKEGNIVEFVNKKVYNISKTIYINKDTNIYGNWATININDGTYFQDWTFSYNRDSSGSAISTTPKITSEIKELIIKGNKTNIEENNFMVICQQVDIHHLRFENVNRCIYFTSDYVDRGDIHHIYCSNCAIDDYAISLGSQGDCKYIHDSQMGNLSDGTNKFVKCGNNLMNVVIDRLVNCSMEIKSPATITNIMLSFTGIIDLYNYKFKLENIMLSRNALNDYRVILHNEDLRQYNPSIEINNLRGLFVNTQNTTITENVKNMIKIDKCSSYKFTNVLTGFRNGNNYLDSWLSYANIDFSDSTMNIYNECQHYFNGKEINSNNLIEYEKNSIGKVGISNISESANFEYKGINGTYYYALQTLLEDIFSTDLSQERNLTLTGGCPYIRTNKNDYPFRVRILKGTSTGVYTQYADVTLIQGRFIDNGISVNGIEWKTFATPISSVSNNTSIQKIKGVKYINNLNKEYYSTRSPIDNPTYFNTTFNNNDRLTMVTSPFKNYVYDSSNSQWLEI